MKRIELLAPAGSFEALKAAISSGANAIYLGGMRFGARAFANNFDQEELIEAVRYCHIRNVKVYVTVNTLLYENEIQEAIDYIGFLYHAQVDALIIQDLGLFEILKEIYPDFEIHCSTQMHIHNQAGVSFIKKQGAKRVVLARETPIELVKQCCQEGIDIEVFVYGALCISYSGQCLMSSLNGGRSGNRGECAQPCRLKYHITSIDQKKTFKQEGEYLLSPKDLFTVEHVPQLIDAGVTSFKIEGRMKRPEYVAEVVRIYREAIDHAYAQKAYILKEPDLNSLKKLFHRGFTSGHLFSETGRNLMNPMRPNHQGVLLGTVLQTSPGIITIALCHDLHQKDGIRILSTKEDMGMQANRIVKQGLLVSGALANEIIDLEVSVPILCKKGDQVVLTTDSQQCDEIQKTIQSYYQRIPLSFKGIAKIGQPMILEVSDGIHQVQVQSLELVAQAQKAPVTEEKIAEQWNKLNDTPYQLESLEMDKDEAIFISLKTINELRRDAIQLMDEQRTRVMRRMNQFDEEDLKPSVIPPHLVQVSTAMQANLAKEKGYTLFGTEHTNEIYPSLPRSDEQNAYQEADFVLIQQLGSFMKKKKNAKWVASFGFNVTNSYALRFMHRHGVDAVVASLEADNQQIESMIEAYVRRYQSEPNVGKWIYGRRECMMMKHCVLNTAFLDGNRKNCNLCQSQQFALVNEKGKRFLFSKDALCHSILLEEEPYQSFTLPTGCQFSFTSLTTESENETKEILKKIKSL